MSRLTELEARMAELQAQLAEVTAQQAARPNLYDLPDCAREAEWKARKPLGRRHSELVTAIAAQEKAIQRELWEPAPMMPVAFLLSLRDAIVNGPEPPKRTPKWRFRVADDFALQIQAKDSARILFEGVALEGEGIKADSFTEKRSDHRRVRQLNFRILEGGTDEHWRFKPRSAHYSQDDGVCRYPNDSYEARHQRELDANKRLMALKARIVDALGSMFNAGEIPMLSDSCLICGKGLTDAVSRSRLIGPECANNWTREGARIVTPLYIRRSNGSDGEEAAR